MTSLARPLIASVTLSDSLLAMGTADLTTEQARRRARGDRGVSVLWTVGHLAHYRHVMLSLAGESRPSPFAAQFQSAAATDGAGYPDLPELMSTWRDLSARLVAALSGASEAQLLATTVSGPHGEKSMLDSLSFFVWHEPYHIGQIGSLRVQMGLPALSELAAAGRTA